MCELYVSNIFDDVGSIHLYYIVIVLRRVTLSTVVRLMRGRTARH